MTEKERGQLVLYETEDGLTRVECRFLENTLWLSLNQMAELFGRDKSVISKHLKSIYEDEELSYEATVAKNATVQIEGSRRVERTIDYYNLEAIFAVGYRVHSPRGVQFRAWATRILREFVTKGFAMDDERLKDPGGWDYFDELLARIREIRASEKRFYQKVRDLFALSVDYRADDREVQLFFAEVQNKLLYAVTRQTAAEIVVARADPTLPNMALTSWSGSRMRRHDVVVAKNYLTAEEVDTLNRLVVIFLDQAELRAREREQLTLDYWRNNVDRLLEFNERPLLDHPGSVSHEEMKAIAGEHYETFDARRRGQEALQADAEDLRTLEEIGKKAKEAGKR
jgi:hypothetical protein